MRRYISIALILASIVLFTSSVRAGGPATLNLDKSSYSVAPGDTFTVSIVVNAGSNNILGTDAYLLYDSSLIEAESVAAGSFFPSVVNSLATAGKAYVAGLVEDPGTSKTGSGTLATITFKALKAGTGTLSYDCRAGASDSSKIVKNDIDATNIIDCTSNQSAPLTIGGTSTVTGTVTPTSSASSSATLTPTSPTKSTVTTPSALPKSGVFDSILRYSVPGVILIILGGVTKLLL